ncbi:zinc-ribbon domain-containing protein [Nocardia brasiliensis]|uniref:zinc-ribbon domain-containing protein n=1 Tax=Nocardia brasiliensis TaxID=37326 RepID=UPI003CC7D62C
MSRGKPEPGRSLLDLFPLQAAEWHPTRNGDLTAADVSPRSNRNRWWICSFCAEEWQAIVNNRTTKRSVGCRSCSRKRAVQKAMTPKVGEALSDLFPELAAEWHPTRNGQLTPELTRPSLHEKVWWLCSECSHEWQMELRRRTSAPFSGCPPCSNRRVSAILRTPEKGQSLQDLRPDVAAQWHPTRNEGLSPRDVSHASGTRVWWLCPNRDCGHEWETAVSNRTSGKQTKCPVCSRRHSHLPEPGRSFPERFPEVALQWHPTKNGKLAPERLKAGSSQSVWWLCPVCGHEWTATVASRTSAGTGCWPCSYKLRIAARDVPKPGQSFLELFSEIAAQWHPTKNNDLQPSGLKPGSDRLVWWVCPDRGHEWQARVYTRTGPDRTGCPECVHLPAFGEAFSDLHPEVARQWHPTKNGNRRPEQFKPGSAYKAWWKCDVRGHVWQVSIHHRSSGSGCPKCIMWGTSEKEIRLAYELAAAGCPVEYDHPRIAVVGRRPVNADIVIPEWNIIIEYDGSQFHARPEGVVRDRRQSDALEAAGWVVIRIRPEPLPLLGDLNLRVGANAAVKEIATAVLLLLAELGYRPRHLRRYERDSELWATAEADAVICRHFAASLSALFPDVAMEWHPTKNGDRRPETTNAGSKMSAWWICAVCQHVWQTRPQKRTTEGSGCPSCASATRAIARRIPKPGRSLGDVYPNLVKIFHPVRNGTITPFDLNPGTARELWWLCPACGHEWATTSPRNTGCRPCASRRRAFERSTPDEGQSLADLYPHIARHWHPTKNGSLRPEEVNPGSVRRIWWLCDVCGYEWERNVAGRVQNDSGCMKCSAKQRGKNRRIPKEGFSLVETHPDLAAQWHRMKNTGLRASEVAASSGERVWWLCPTCGYEWKALVWARARNGHGCKCCASVQLSITKRRPKPGRSLRDVKPHLVSLWHPTRNGELTPNDVNPNSHTRVWWQCPDCGREWQATPGSPGCRPCSMKRVGAQLSKVKPGNSLAEKYPEIAAQWHPDKNGTLGPDNVNAGTSTNYWWICSVCNHEWLAKPTNRTRQVYLCPKCKLPMRDSR